MITAIVAYFFTGGYVISYYRDFPFVFLKIIQSFFRGSIDNIDHDTTTDEYAHTSTLSLPKNFNELIVKATGPYNSIIADMSSTGYLIVKLLFKNIF
jgi:hypothetical protein